MNDTHATMDSAGPYTHIGTSHITKTTMDYKAFLLPHSSSCIPLPPQTPPRASNTTNTTERTVHAVREFVREVASVTRDNGEHVIPIIIGGDHSLMYPDVAALADHDHVIADGVAVEEQRTLDESGANGGLAIRVGLIPDARADDIAAHIADHLCQTVNGDVTIFHQNTDFRVLDDLAVNGCSLTGSGNIVHIW